MLLFGVSSVLAFEPPDRQARADAVGPLQALPTVLRRTFMEDGSFAPMAKPQVGEWLASRKEVGQTFAQYVQSRPNKPGDGGRGAIYLQPIGKFPKEGVQLEDVRKFLEVFYQPLKVVMLHGLDESELMVTTRVNRGTDKLQMNCTELLDELERRVPADAYIVMAVTMTDLYPSEQWNFVFGMARLKNRVGAFSLARYGTDDPLLASQRAVKVVAHETGHAFGMAHCVHYRCLMNGVNHLGEADKVPMTLCPVCLRKLHYATGYNPVKRYSDIAEWWSESGDETQVAWYSKRVKTLTR